MMTNLVGLYHDVLELSPYLPKELGSLSKSLDDGGMLADLIASSLNISKAEKQSILETRDVKERLTEVTRIINRELQVLQLGQKIQSQVKQDMDKAQRDFYLRQQLKAIKEELGEKDESATAVEDYRAKIAEKDLPEEALKEAERELERLSRMHPSSAEYTVSTTFLDWLTALPWNEGTEDILDIAQARKVLDEDHYDLDKVKKRIIEYLAVRKLKPDSKGPMRISTLRPSAEAVATPRPSRWPRCWEPINARSIRMSTGSTPPIHGSCPKHDGSRRSATTKCWNWRAWGPA